MKKITYLLTVLSFLILPSISSAHPGNTDSSGCHTCRTNCSSWGLYTGEYHCHNNKGFTQPEYPIHSTYGAGGTGYTSPAPDYAYPSLSIPKCPLHSYYDGSSCKCNYGYVASGGSCVSEDSLCQKQIGYNSSYNSLDNTCECNYGYVLDSTETCALGNLVCIKKIGLMSEYNSLTNKCECMDGYVFDGTSCVSHNKLCQSEYGSNSYEYAGQCRCLAGYEFNKNKTACVLTPIKTNDEICQESFGINSTWNGTKNSNETLNCQCKTGFMWSSDNSYCLKEIKPIYLQGCNSLEGYSSTTHISCDGSNKCQSGMRYSTEKKECVSIPTETPKQEIVENNKLGASAINSNIEILQDEIDQKIPIDYEKPEKVKWFKRLFGWMFGK